MASDPGPVLPCWYCNGLSDGSPYSPEQFPVGWACEACDERRVSRAAEAVVEAARHVKRGLPDWESDDWANSGFPALERALAAYDKARSG